MTQVIEYEEMPEEVKDIVDSFDEDKNTYGECLRIKFELQSIGWTCDHGLSGEVYDVREYE